MSELKRIIEEAVGEASMQWEPRPTGVFDSTGASGVVDRTVALVEGRIAQLESQLAERDADLAVMREAVTKARVAEGFGEWQDLLDAAQEAADFATMRAEKAERERDEAVEHIGRWERNSLDKANGLDVVARCVALERERDEAAEEAASMVRFLEVQLGWEWFWADGWTGADPKSRSMAKQNALEIRKFLDESGHAKKAAAIRKLGGGT